MPLPDSGTAPWLPLVLDEGQPGATDGLLVHVQDVPFVVASDGHVSHSPAGIPSMSRAVPLAVSVPDPGLAALDNRWVTAAGTLQSQQLLVDVVRPRAAPADAARTDRRPTGLRAGDVPASRHGTRPSRRIPAERALLEQGIVLDLWTDERTGRRIALTTDVGLTTDMLAPHYRESLDVVASRWDRRYLDEILNEVDEELVMSVGHSISTDRQLRLAVTLLHLPSRLAYRLADYRAEALDVRVLVRPAGLASDF
ncbi:hypothetical protein [Catenuloplanes japonicus]|uniref:hypothetical protein n=1 Tax=Catenuloplanes japonicus TaxID=33876 RepID=UPI0005260314|nr:hypothetical protein [Catenuloplanes japonicus]